AHADPFEMLPLGVPQLLVHGDRDDTVPVELSRAWSRRAAQRGDPCELVVLPGVDHFALIDPGSPAWQTVADRLPAPAVDTGGGAPASTGPR
ncbi:MAG: prolyl oligopeptidase family serine peptidase, partial [Candidatus Dormibacteraeota bacterium]|nr:prolyl oligopeptidase family serine peptidase [Candidatus Dormibacteraeota bacterium]